MVHDAYGYCEKSRLCMLSRSCVIGSYVMAVSHYTTIAYRILAHAIV